MAISGNADTGFPFRNASHQVSGAKWLFNEIVTGYAGIAGANCNIGPFA